MSWVSPRTWVTDEIVTAAQLNEQLRDNTTFLQAVALNKKHYQTTGTFSTSSTSYVNVTGASIVITPAVTRLILGFSGELVVGGIGIGIGFNANGSSDIDLISGGLSNSVHASTRIYFYTVTAGVALTLQLRARSASSAVDVRNFSWFAMEGYNV